MEKQEYKVQRKVITWEEVVVEADSFDDALDLATRSDSWDEVYDQSEATESYWIKNLDTNDCVSKDGYYSEWEEAI